MANRTHEYPLLIVERHLDTFGHVNNATYLELFEEARWDWLQQNGYGLDEIRKRDQEWRWVTDIAQTPVQGRSGADKIVPAPCVAWSPAAECWACSAWLSRMSTCSPRRPPWTLRETRTQRPLAEVPLGAIWEPTCSPSPSQTTQDHRTATL